MLKISQNIYGKWNMSLLFIEGNFDPFLLSIFFDHLNPY